MLCAEVIVIQNKVVVGCKLNLKEVLLICIHFNPGMFIWGYKVFGAY